MNIDAFIKSNIGMLDNNSISVNNLANKLCVTMYNQYGIPRDERVESYIVDVLTKYKRREINASQVTEFLNPVVSGNVEPSINTQTSSSTTSNTSSNNTINVSTNTTVDPYVKDMIGKNVQMLDNNSISVDNLANKLTIELGKYQYGFELDENGKAGLRDILARYKRHEVTSDDVAAYYNGLLYGESESSSQVEDTTSSQIIEEPIIEKEPIVEEKNDQIYGGIGQDNVIEEEAVEEQPQETIIEETPLEPDQIYGGSVENNVIEQEPIVEEPLEPDRIYGGSGRDNVIEVEPEEQIIEEEGIADVETDAVMDIASQLSSVESAISGASITVPGGIAPFAAGIEQILESGKSAASSVLTDIKGALVETVNANEEIDDEVNQPEVNELSFEDIYNMAYDKRKNSQLVEADANFFIKNGCTVNGTVAIIKANGKEYRYDISSHTLSINGTDSVKCKIFVPSGATDFSKLNTYTYFTSTTESKNKQPYDKLINGKVSNSIVIQIAKPDVQTKGNNSNNAKFIKQYEVSEATRFVNAVAKTDISSGKCRNIIGGDSVYGAHSLKMAATHTDLYQTVYCIDNAVIVTNDGSNGGNGVRGIKEQFVSMEELEKLNGKDIYFISVTGDDNFRYYEGTKTTKDAKKGYVYTGLELICQHCPNANIHMIYNEGNGKHKDIINALKELESSYSNYSYEPNEWYNYADANYEDHTAGQILVTDLVSADTTNKNCYTVE